MKLKEPSGMVTQTNQTTIGMYDRALVTNITLGVTISLTNYEFLKIDVSGTDPDNNRKALIEILSTVIPAQDEVRRECIDKYIKNVLIRVPK